MSTELQHDVAPWPEWDVVQWFNTPQPLTLAGLRGRIVLVHTFQMLCPGCVSHGLPQAIRAYDMLDKEQVAVVGLHTVFEHHAVMGAQALEVFIHEYRLRFPIGIDRPSEDGPIPRTMAAWQLRGTPSLVLLDATGRARLQHFGAIDDLALGAMVGQLLAEPAPEPRSLKP